jgi:hypothetical protein
MPIDNEKKELIDNVLTSALSGISSQWINMVVVKGGNPTEDTIAEALIKKQSVEFHVIEESRKYGLTIENLMDTIANYGLEHDMCKHCLNDNMDDEIGDVILQEALFGEYRYA